MYVYFMRVQAISKMCFCTGRGRRHVIFFVIFSSHDLPTTEKVLKYMQTRAWYINPRSAAYAVWVVGTGACTESMTADRIVTFEGAHFIHPEKCTCTDSSTDSSRAPYFVPVAWRGSAYFTAYFYCVFLLRILLSILHAWIRAKCALE